MAKKKTIEKEKKKKYSKYEKAKLIGARALQISMGAPVYVELSKKDLAKINYNPIEIAKMELENNVIPLDVVKNLPHEKEEKKVKENK